MKNRDFEIGSRKFKLNKIDVFKQLFISKRISPLLAEMVPILAKMQNEKIDPNQLTEDQTKMFAPLVGGFSKLSDDDARFILIGLCSAVEMQQMPTGNWARVATESAGLMFDDLELPELIKIAWESFLYNLSGFIKGHRLS